MLKKFFIVSSMVMIMAVTGCASTDGGGVTTRMYLEDRPRVDQKIPEDGNQGYLVGAPDSQEPGDVERTRKMFVLEITQNPPNSDEVRDIKVIERTIVRTVPAPAPAPRRELPESRPAPVAESDPVIEYVDYTIEKNDTLQKISKKFYDTYRKWPRIYEANKDVIEDPNRITPGIEIRIPMEK